MSDKEWDEVRQDFRDLVVRDGVKEVARRAHIHKATVYRIFKGETGRPSGPLRAAIENIVASATPPDAKVGEA